MLFDNLRDRFNLISKANGDRKLQALIIDRCKKDPKYFFNNFLFTVRNDTFFSGKMQSNIPFVLFDYQEELVDTIWFAITHKRNIFTEKSRQMSVTWVVLGLFLYGFLFYNHRYLVVSRTEDEVDGKGTLDSCFGRMRYMIDLLPEWMLPPGFDKVKGTDNNKAMAISRGDNVGSIIGKTANPSAGRGGTYSAAFMDEMAFMQDAKDINSSLSSATPCRIMNSTPFGENGEYYEMRKLANQQKSKGINDRSVIGITLHWTLHPYYTPEWYAWYTSSKTPEQIEQELEINYSVSIQGRVYREFFPSPIGSIVISESYEYDATLPLYCSIDNSHGGSDPHALIFFHVNKEGEIIIFDNLEVNCSITEIASILARRPVQGNLGNKILNFYQRYTKYRHATFIADPNDTNTTWNDTSIASEYAKVGIILTTPNILRGLGGQIDEQVRLTQQNIHRVRVHPRCEAFLSAVQNARYPQVKEGSESTTGRFKPIHDWTSHYRTSLEYAMLFLLENEKTMPYEKQKTSIIREIPNHITGQIDYQTIYV